MVAPSSLSGTRIIITGGAGFIGHHSVAAAVSLGAQVMVIDDLRHAHPAPLPAGVELITAELATPEAKAAFMTFKPQAVLHLAAQGGVIRSFRDPVTDVRANIVATVAVIDACREAGVKRLVFSSSGGALYGHASILPSPEDSPSQPLSPYGLAKWSCEQYINLFAAREGLSALSLRYGNVYGPLQDGTGEAGIVAITSTRILAKQTPEIFGDGTQSRDFTFVGDIARANMLALSSACTGACNIGTGVDTEINTIIDTLVAHAQWDGGVVHYPARPGEVLHSVLDVRRAHTELDWVATMELSEGLAITFDSFASPAIKRTEPNLAHPTLRSAT